jgi:hypothetical protein
MTDQPVTRNDSRMRISEEISNPNLRAARFLPRTTISPRIIKINKSARLSAWADGSVMQRAPGRSR